ncbi:Peroxisome biogenesis protein 12 [Tetrabaena socialis]|uniref:Peroxisome biogenesis protein 12 n=1 Tax=Tetrabaena socialis TaxID=47790 RepID=A0A2J8A214_9CHLO|nr:Peroxisome biogenesis protein 12 [Tetrabaena socialis]|eukprot:PNH06566.1 Peroxisome biogenesis protein 12 [Tetrabaena socialis]
MFVHLGGDSSTPTYFEVVAADRLVPSLKAAVVYALSVFSQRHPWVHRLLAYDDEVFALLTLALDGQSLLGSDSTFADGLYGLKRRPLRAAAPAPAAGAGAGADPGPVRLTRHQRWLLLAAQVLLPYLRAKLDKAYRRAAAPRGGVLGLAIRYGVEQESRGDSGAPRPDGGLEATTGGVRQLLQRALVVSYPWIHAGLEGTTFAYHLSFLLGAAPVHHPVLHALGVAMARTSSQDLALEWWYTTAEEAVSRGKALPTPPPPPPPRPVPPPAGVGLPLDPSDCPVCRRRTTNPAAVATSGYVCCYPCAFNHVMQHGCCPVSLVPATLDHVRKLYEAS